MQCPCHSKRSYDSCCKMIHEGKLSESPVDLMRARYSAYALKLSDFIIDTTEKSSMDLSQRENLP